MIIGKKLTLETQLHHSTEQVGCRVGNEIVLLSVKNGEYYNLNPSASSIWESLENKTSIDQVVEKQRQQYDVGVNQCQQEVMHLIGRLLDEGLLEISH